MCRREEGPGPACARRSRSLWRGRGRGSLCALGAGVRPVSLGGLRMKWQIGGAGVCLAPAAAVLSGTRVARAVFSLRGEGG